MRILHLPILFLSIFTLFFTNLVMGQPGNDAFANARLITTDSTCKTGISLLTIQTLSGATYVANEINTVPASLTSACTFVASQDVWYKFVAKSTAPTVSVYNLGSSWGSTLKLQLYDGISGSLVPRHCSNNYPITPTPLDFALIIGTTYYIRVHKDNTTAPTGTNWGFDICVTDNVVQASRMKEIFSRTYLSGAGVLNFPWEITYGPDNNLWITESKGYKVYKMNPNTGSKTTVLDISQGSIFLPVADRTFNCQFANGAGAQGGLAGLALHPNFLDGTGSENNSVYISYIFSSNGGSAPNGVFFTNRLVKFNYNKTTGLLESPVSLCDTLPGSSDHNSQRMIIAPVIPGGTKYLFYASGDMGSGQFGNRDRVQKAQFSNSYEGKILRFNLISDGDAGLNAWLPNAPNANPYGATSAVYCIGIRNNQGFAYDTALNILYGSSHGPYSDDEINIIEPSKNYGHPLVIGYSSDGNYNGTVTSSTNTSISAGAAFTDNSGNSACPAIGNEVSRMNAINTANPGSYKDPVFSAYASSAATISNTWKTNPGNGGWESEGWSGLDLYSGTSIPGWKKSLVAAGLKWGRLIRLPLDTTGTKTLPSNIGGTVGNAGDTITYFQSTNRYRDLTIAPNGKDLYMVMDNSSATSGPGTANPSAAACPGCVVKYTFLGYAAAASAVGTSTIPKSINVTTGTLNSCNSGTSITIDATNNNLWVPITGPDGNIMAEINAMGQNMGIVTSSFYKKAPAPNSIRVKAGVYYLDRNITITPAITSYATPVKVRLYISTEEFDSLKNNSSSGISTISDIKIHKNNDVCLSALNANTTVLNPTNPALADLMHGAKGYVLQTAVTSFSSFYFAGNVSVLPVDQLSFSGSLQDDLSTLLNWKTETEINVAGFDLERSVGGNIYTKIGYIKARGNTNNGLDYSLTDNEASNQQSLILYYRLKIIDKNGSFKYSNIITITLPVTKALLSIAPNPVVNDIRGIIISPITGNVTVRIFDNIGRLVLQTNSFVRKGSNNFVQNINALASGAYYIDISGNGIVSRSKFQKL